MMYRNLAAAWANYAAVGVRRLLLVEAVEDRDALARLRRAISGAELVVCRLMADLETMWQRIRVREPGMLRQHFLTRVTELQAVLDESHLEDFSVANQCRPVTDVAHEMLSARGLPRGSDRSSPVHQCLAKVECGDLSLADGNPRHLTQRHSHGSAEPT
jgi:hypothetical protein